MWCLLVHSLSKKYFSFRRSVMSCGRAFNIYHPFMYKIYELLSSSQKPAPESETWHSAAGGAVSAWPHTVWSAWQQAEWRERSCTGESWGLRCPVHDSRQLDPARTPAPPMETCTLWWVSAVMCHVSVSLSSADVSMLGINWPGTLAPTGICQNSGPTLCINKGYLQIPPSCW